MKESIISLLGEKICHDSYLLLLGEAACMHKNTLLSNSTLPIKSIALMQMCLVTLHSHSLPFFMFSDTVIVFIRACNGGQSQGNTL